ncbi:MAG: ABC transporter ATP-binding protein [Pseudomonadota bacterium]
MDESAPIIRLRGVSFAYNHHRQVLKNLDFDFFEGQRAGLRGVNGSGKTTLFHLIMGLLSPEKGVVEIFGRARARERDFREVRAKIGFVFQDADDQLFCPTVAEDVAFGPLNLGLSHDQARAVVRETLALLGLTGFEDRITYKLSGGEKKLVSLATVLAMKPRLLLLDEPTTGLDEQTTERFIGVLRESGLPYLIISHDRKFLSRTVDAFFRMDGGGISREVVGD